MSEGQIHRKALLGKKGNIQNIKEDECKKNIFAHLQQIVSHRQTLSKFIFQPISLLQIW